MPTAMSEEVTDDPGSLPVQREDQQPTDGRVEVHTSPDAQPSAKLAAASAETSFSKQPSAAPAQMIARKPGAEHDRQSPDPPSPPRRPLENLERAPTAMLSPQDRAARAAKRAHQAAQALSFAALLLLFLATSLYMVISFRGWNQYTAAAGDPCMPLALALRSLFNLESEDIRGHAHACCANWAVLCSPLLCSCLGLPCPAAAVVRAQLPGVLLLEAP